MTPWIQRFLAFTILWVVLLLAIHIMNVFSNKKEKFLDAPWNRDELAYVNKGQAPWLHYAIHQSNISDPIIKYKNAYYYEMPNEEYENALKHAFALKSCNALTQALRKAEWSDAKKPSEVLGSRWVGVYEQWLAEFTQTINAAPELKLTGDTTAIQVVHDRWIAVHTHVNDPTLLRMDIEVILYRMGKPHGKHVSMSVIAKRMGDEGKFATTVVAIEILGVVPEDQIALFPVVASNPFDPPEMAYNENITIVPSGTEVLQELQRRSSQNVATFLTQQKLGA